MRNIYSQLNRTKRFNIFRTKSNSLPPTNVSIYFPVTLAHISKLFMIPDEAVKRANILIYISSLSELNPNSYSILLFSDAGTRL